jgi:hypothetical protein
MTLREWQTEAVGLRARAQRLSARMVAEARELAGQAGLDPTAPFHHAHNALVAAEVGHPWPEVNYSLARRIRWLQGRSFIPGQLVDSIIRRHWARVPR